MVRKDKGRGGKGGGGPLVRMVADEWIGEHSSIPPGEKEEEKGKENGGKKRKEEKKKSENLSTMYLASLYEDKSNVEE